jgi:hypothetical protein
LHHRLGEFDIDMLGVGIALADKPSSNQDVLQMMMRTVSMGALEPFYAGATSTIASKVAWPAEKWKMSTASSGIAGAPDVSRFRPSQPSRIHTVPDGIRSVTWAWA